MPRSIPASRQYSSPLPDPSSSSPIGASRIMLGPVSRPHTIWRICRESCRSPGAGRIIQVGLRHPPTRVDPGEDRGGIFQAAAAVNGSGSAAHVVHDDFDAKPSTGPWCSPSAEAYFVLYPRSRVTTWIFPIFLVKIPAWIYLRLWFLDQLIEAFGLFHAHANGGGVGFFAHVGGFVFGLLVTQLLTRTGHLAPA